MASKPKTKPAFKPGSVVEVSSDEPGFRGSFYRATVVKPLPSPSDSYLVRYHTLVSDSSQPLTEVAAASQLRPPPPETPGRRIRFGMGDEVDVYHNDGWWSAVVTAELGGGEFELFFRGYKEQLVFGEKDFRVHRDWVDGVWVPQFDEDEPQEEQEQERAQKPQIVEANGNRETAHNELEKGMSVEVSSDEDGLEGAWFAATIVEPVGKEKGKFLVQYQSLRTDDDENFLREEIDVGHIRHCPPETMVPGGFKLLEEVDCLYNDGWWVGVVSAVLGDSVYKVYFKSTKEEMEFRRSEMRLHQEWINGKWVVASQALNL